MQITPPLKHGDIIIWGQDCYWICYTHRGINTISSFSKRLFEEDVCLSIEAEEEEEQKDLFDGMQDGFFYEEDIANND